MSARSLNRVQLIGNLTRDPELRYTPKGTAVCTFGLATNRSWTPNDGGERQEETEFHRIVAWSKLAEICSQLLYKGRKAYVEGRLQTRTWQGQDGQERTTTEVVIDSMIALGAPKRVRDNMGGDYEEEENEMGYEESGGQMDEEMSDEAPAEEEKGGKEKGGKKKGSSKAKSSSSKKKKSSGKGGADEDVADDIPF